MMVVIRFGNSSSDAGCTGSRIRDNRGMIAHRVFPLLLLATLLCPTVPSAWSADATSANSDQLKRALKQFPAADLNGDGILSQTELRTFHRERAQRMRAGRNTPGFDTVFKPTTEQLNEAKATGGRQSRTPLKFAKGKGLRILMTGHSWVAPANRTLPGIAKVAGLDGHQQRVHISGGATGSANAIWLKEFGKFRADAPKPILVPAIATGEWDVMTWGSYYNDKPENFSQWIDLCLKYNPDMKFFIQDGWPRVGSADAKLQPAAAVKKLTGEMNRMVNEYFTPGLEVLNQRYPGKVHFVPAGPAVVELIRRYYDQKLPGFDCLSENFGGSKGIYRDGGHLSKKSGAEHLVGYVYYATLYRRSPTLLPKHAPDGVPAVIDRELREIAWETVGKSPLSGIADKDADGMAD